MKAITIEWRHLVEKGNTCMRCSDTGQALNLVIEQLNKECRNCGWRIDFIETPLSAMDIAESNSILINGAPIEDILPGAESGESHCESCCEMIGTSTNCRTVEFAGDSFAAIPESMIHSAICRVAGC
ncbi:MAG: DUF2703 domain-containing protein [Pseudomonadota bacterium]